MGHQPPPDKIEQLREATRLANEALKDLKTERKHIEDLLASIRPDTIKIIEGIVSASLEGMTDGMREGIDKSVKRILLRFERLEDTLLGGTALDRERVPLEDLAEAFVKKREEVHAPFKPPPLL